MSKEREEEEKEEYIERRLKTRGNKGWKKGGKERQR